MSDWQDVQAMTTEIRAARERLRRHVMELQEERAAVASKRAALHERVALARAKHAEIVYRARCMRAFGRPVSPTLH
jgi:uncharacterized coiled-coil DUF342 family protein